MSKTYEGGPVTITVSGKTVTTAASTASTGIPVDSAGNIPRYVRIAATGESYIRLGGASVAATANDVLIQPADALVIATVGSTTIAYIQGTATAKVSIIPLENQ